MNQWKKQVRDWWYGLQDSYSNVMRIPPHEWKRVEIEHIIKEAITTAKREVLREVRELVKRHETQGVTSEATVRCILMDIDELPTHLESELNSGSESKKTI